MGYRIAILSLMALQALSVTALPPCTCTRNLRPVCGSDGNTYGNECLLNCLRNVYVVSQGPCDDSVKVAEIPCICPGFVQEVCGTDGNTYDNSCKLNCATAFDSTLGIKYQGKCDNTVNVAEVPCVCPDVIDEVCGTDGNTYDNSCILNCESAKDSMLGIKYGGKCDNTVNVAEVPCVCPDVIEEVCGTDGNTYDNSCILNCETARDSTLGIKYEGKCEKPKCTCPRDLKPVCGTDGATYGNQCLLGCAGAHVSLARHGPC